MCMLLNHSCRWVEGIVCVCACVRVSVCVCEERKQQLLLMLQCKNRTSERERWMKWCSTAFVGFHEWISLICIVHINMWVPGKG